MCFLDDFRWYRKWWGGRWVRMETKCNAEPYGYFWVRDKEVEVGDRSALGLICVDVEVFEGSNTQNED